jgi:hypothetical protein
LGGHVVVLDKLDQLGAVSVKLEGRIFEGVTFTVLFHIELQDFFPDGVVR